MITEVRTIGIIGHGNVGSHLVNIFSKYSKSLDVIVFSRKAVSEERHLCDVKYTQRLEDLSMLDVVIIAVKDDAIVAVLDLLKSRISMDTVVCHCSGSVSSTVIQPYFKRYGVVYPLQTFSKNRSINYREIPVFITGSDDNTTAILHTVAGKISSLVKEIDDNQRLSLHIAAVFCSNYTNAMYSIGQKMCEDHQLEFEYLKPLILETARKVMDTSPGQAQTGPAIRRDFDIIQKHENYLINYDKPISLIYRYLAEYIGRIN